MRCRFFRSRVTSQKLTRTVFKPTLERLEELVLPTVTLSGFDSAMGTITFTGDCADDILVLGAVDQGGGMFLLGYKQGSDPSFITDLGSGNHLVLGSGSDPAITVNLGDGNDTLTLDSSWTFQHPIAVDAGPGTNTLNGPNLSVDWNLSDITGDLTTNGTPTLNPSCATSFSNFQALQGGTGNDSFFINDAVTANLKGGADADTFVFAEDATLTGAIDGQAGIDTLDYGSNTTQISLTLSDADAGGFSGNDGISSGFNGMDNAVAGTSQTDILIGQNTNSTWTLNDDPTYSNGSQTFSFSNFRTLQGGTGDDTFNIVVPGSADLRGGSGSDNFVYGDGTTLDGTIDGEAGSDTLILADYSSPVSITLIGSTDNGFSGTDGVTSGFNNVDAIIGGSGSDVLTGYDVPATWSLAGSKTYSAETHSLTFSGFEDLQGGSEADNFVLENGATWSGILDGSSGSDQLDLGAYSTALNVVLDGSDDTGFSGWVAGAIGNFSGIDSVTGGTSASITGENVDAIWTLDSTLSYSDGANTLAFSGFSTLQGGGGADTFNILASTTANLKGGDGDDVFQFQADNVALTGSIAGETGSNLLSYAGYNSTSVTITITTSNAVTGFGGSGTNLSGGFSCITSVLGGDATDTLIGRNVASTWSVGTSSNYTVGSAALSCSGFEILQGGSAVDTFDIWATNTINLKGGNGNDTFTFTVDGVTAGNINGEGGNDRLSYAGFTSDVTVAIGSDITGIEILVGGSESDTLIGADVSNTWRITGTNAGTVGSLAFSSFENLTGGSNADLFILSNGKVVTGTISGGGGADTLNFGNYSSPIAMTTTGTDAGTISGSFHFSAMENLIGSKGNDSFNFSEGNLLSGTVNGNLGKDTLNFSACTSGTTVNVTSNNGGTIASMAFTALENWIGGSGNDTVNFSAGKGFSGTVNGGLGTDLLNFAAFTNPIAVAVQTNNTGRIASSGVGFAFFSMESWTGGIGNDAVVFANGKGMSGALNGGPGNDRLDYSAYLTGVLVDLSVPVATSTGSIMAFENVTGGSGSDILIGDDTGNVLVGGAGRNILVGNAGNDRLFGGVNSDILIGGSGDDVLNGGGGSDLLIAGSTSFDSTVTALASIRAEWGRADVGYCTRIKHLNGTVSGGANGAIILNYSTVSPDAGADILAGAGDSDWFIISAGDSILDRVQGEVKTVINFN